MMINTFSLVLVSITGASGIVWMLGKLFLIMNTYNFYGIKLFKKLECIGYQSDGFYSKVIMFCIRFFRFISSVFPALFLIFIIRSFIYEPFQIPSGSMMPTLLIGDFVLVEKFVYGIKNPINQRTLINVGQPKRGDVMVFKYPKDPKLFYIKRVIGEPGDRIIYNIISKQLTIYPNNLNFMSNNTCEQPLSIVYSDVCPSSFMQMFAKSKDGVIETVFVEIENYNSNQDFNGIRLTQSTELLDKTKHDILTMIPPGDIRFAKMYEQHVKHLISEWIVPVGEYFVMGDNRDNSSDSRYWGCVPERYVVGKAAIIWMSLKNQEDLWWPISIRFNRVGKIQ